MTGLHICLIAFLNFPAEQSDAAPLFQLPFHVVAMATHVASFCVRRARPLRIATLKTAQHSFRTHPFRIPRPFTPLKPVSISTAVSYTAFSRFTLASLPLAHLERKYHKHNNELSTPEDVELQKLEPSKRRVIRILDRILDWLDRWFLEPLLVCRRFFHVILLFAPIVICVPIVFIGERQPDEQDERSGTLLWFDLIMTQMERAGPTFIKVISYSPWSRYVTSC